MRRCYELQACFVEAISSDQMMSVSLCLPAAPHTPPPCSSSPLLPRHPTSRGSSTASTCRPTASDTRCRSGSPSNGAAEPRTSGATGVRRCSGAPPGTTTAEVLTGHLTPGRRLFGKGRALSKKYLVCDWMNHSENLLLSVVTPKPRPP